MKKQDLIKIFKKDKIKKSYIDRFDEITRDGFVDSRFKDLVYHNEKILIGKGESADKPQTLMKMINYLSPKKKWNLLEVGTGSGFSTALLSPFVKSIITIDYYDDFVKLAKERLYLENVSNVRFLAGDVIDIDEQFGFFDGMIFFTGCMQPPVSILSLLSVGGKAIFPMGHPGQQQLVVYENDGNTDNLLDLKNYKFLDLCEYESIRGDYGWRDREDQYFDEDTSL